MSQRAYIQLPDAVAIYRLSSGGKKMPHGYNGQLCAQLRTFLLSPSNHLCIVMANTLYQLPLLLLNALTCFSLPYIPIPQIWNGANDQLRRTICSSEKKNFIFPLFRNGAYHMNMKRFEQLPGRIQE